MGADSAGGAGACSRVPAACIMRVCIMRRDACGIPVRRTAGGNHAGERLVGGWNRAPTKWRGESAIG
jgi:hypothetical protein